MSDQVTAFFQDRIIARGSREAVTRAIEDGWPNDQGAVRVFDDASGQVIDLDLWDAAKTRDSVETLPARGRGRPKLGVVAREVTLLPRHWDWLARQPGGASAAIRKLVESARKETPEAGAARDSVYRFLSQMAGDRSGYEEALRALYRGEIERFRNLIAEWPNDIRAFVDDLIEAAAA